MKRATLLVSLAAVLLARGLSSTALAAEGGIFAPVRTYQEQFTDVASGDWYYENVKALYELGLTNGQGSGSLFVPEGNMTVAEVLTMSARLRSLYEYGDSETGPGQYGGGAWYQPYVAYLQSLEVVGQEFEGSYDRGATRAEMAHVLAGTLPGDLLEPINRDVVTAGYLNRNYITDVTSETPYWEDILLLYQWGILSGVDGTGSFLPDDSIPRCQVAAMVTRLVYGELRIPLDWGYAYDRSGTELADLVESDGTFFEAPAPEQVQEIDADVRYMLSRGERTITLSYPAGTLTAETVNALTEAFLSAARLYVEQTYNNILCSYSLRSGSVTMTFSSSLYEEQMIDHYRASTMEYAIQVHNALWADGTITPDMSEYDKARVYFTWVCEHCQYDYSAKDDSMSHSGYSAFTTGLAVCDGYTAAYNLLLKLEGISCRTESTANHIWTIAELDGTEYHIDTTWGDRTGTIAYRYFAMTETDSLARFA